MLKKLALVAIPLITIAMPLPSEANPPPAEICQIIWQGRMKSDGGGDVPTDPPEGCPKDFLPGEVPPPPPPCVPDAFTGVCMLEG